MNLDTFYSLCGPAKLYFIISILGLTNSKNLPTTYSGILILISIQLFFIFLWTYFLQLLCGKGYFKVAWFLVLFPLIFLFVFLFLTIIAIFFFSKNKDKEFAEVINDPSKGSPSTSTYGEAVHRRGNVGLELNDVLL